MKDILESLFTPEEVARISIVLAICGFIWANAKIAESLFREEALQALSMRIFGQGGRSTFENLGGDICTIVAHLLGSSDGSLPKFRRTAMVSTIAVVFAFAGVFFGLGVFSEVADFFDAEDRLVQTYTFGTQFLANLALTFIWLFSLNLLLDYISFSKGIVLAARFLTDRGVLGFIKYIVYDFALTITLVLLSFGFLMGFSSVGMTFEPIEYIDYETSKDLNQVFLTSLIPLFLSTFSIAALTGAFTISIVAAKLIWRVDIFRRVLPKYLKTEKHPILISVSFLNFVVIFGFLLIAPALTG